MSKFSYFVGAGSESSLFPHLDRLKPPGLKILDRPDLAIKTAARYLHMKAVIWRQNTQYRDHGGTASKHDGLLHLDYPDPIKFVDERERILDALGWKRNIYNHLHNEAGYSKEVLDWQLAVAKEMVKRKMPCAVGGWAVGNPPIARIAESRPMLELLAEHRDLLILILNEYFAGAWVSGLVGADAKPGEYLYFTRLIPHEKWPKTLDGFTPYHCGRYHHWLAYCDSVGILHPRIHIGEFEADAVSDRTEIENWRKGLLRVDPAKEPRFYTTLAAQWKNWWPHWSLEEALFHQVKACLETIYNDPAIEAVYFFTFGDSGGWADANVERALSFQVAMENYAMVSVTTLFPAKTDPRMVEANFKSTGNNTNIRSTPTKPPVGAPDNSLGLFHEATGKYIPDDKLEPVEKHPERLADGTIVTWLSAWLDIDGKVVGGYIRSNAVRIQHLPSQTPPAPPVVVSPPEPELPAIDWRQDIGALDALLAVATKERDAALERLSEANHALVSIDNRIRLLGLIRSDIEKLLPPEDMKASA